MRLLIFCAFATSLFLMTSCQKEEIQFIEFESATENLILEGFDKSYGDSLTVIDPIVGTTPGMSGSTTTNNNAVDITTYLKNNPDFSTFYSALFKTGMIDQIDGDGPFTFFVPDNQAFQTFLAGNNWSTIDDIPASVLILIVKFHISDTEVKIGDLTNSVSVPIMFNDKTVFINMEDPNNPFVVLGLTTADVIKSDLTQSNGVIHHINGVLSL